MTSTDGFDALDDAHTEHEIPPFALGDAGSVPNHFIPSQAISLWSSQVRRNGNMTVAKLQGDKSQCMSPSSSSPPALVESMLTDGSCSVQSDTSDSGDCTKGPTQRPAVPLSSTFLMSSLHTIHSDQGDSTYLPISSMSTSNNCSPVSPYNVTLHACEGSSNSVGFSQLMQAADDTNSIQHHRLRLGHSRTRQFGQSSRMPPVPENRDSNDSSSASSPDLTDDHSGTLISAPETGISVISHTTMNRRWFSNPQQRAVPGPGNGLVTPLLFTANTRRIPYSPPVTHLLSNQQPAYTLLDEAKATIHAMIDDYESFEASMLIDDFSCTIEDVMRIVGNPDLLYLWCDPIQTLIVTSTSDGDVTRRSSNSINVESDELRDRERMRDREYEGEWVEATTTALGSPPSAVGFVYGVGQSLLESVGCASYGRVTMFVERRRGHVGLTVGPFYGCIHASHTITVSKNESDGGRIRVVDRVRLTRDDEEVTLARFLWCGALESCLSRCLLPSVTDYLDQVTTSMARLKLLVENNGGSGEASILMVDATRRR